ncbi:hypothetical protein [Marimonas lutisalis]|uniref:hypothetical protein n=1 Tax=Marimonas lutisalis TaxID=2545756 RepID=UPI0010F7FCDC|nr:hypothetical protein [Marimonas lutisalis]
MTTQPEYNTIANGSIDYAHYDRRAREIRSQDAWRNIGTIGKMLKAIATMFERGASYEAKPMSKAPGREPMRTPQLRRTRPNVSQVNPETAVR